MLQRDRIIVLKSMPFAESDLIIRGLNQKGNVLSFIAKGSQKSKKRFVGGVLEPTSFIEVEYRPSRASLNRLKQAWFLNPFSKLRKDYKRLNLSFYFLKVVDHISQEGLQDSQELFHLLGNALLQAEKTSSLENLKLFFQMKILYLQGVLPENLTEPSILGRPLERHEELHITSSQRTLFSQEVNQALTMYLEL